VWIDIGREGVRCSEHFTAQCWTQELCAATREGGEGLVGVPEEGKESGGAERRAEEDPLAVEEAVELVLETRVRDDSASVRQEVSYPEQV
jgi:hypothetical protein